MQGRFELINKTYFLSSANNKVVMLLGLFLTDDVARDITFFRKWALGPSPMGSGGNISDLEKEDGKVVLRYIEILENGAKFVTTIEKFVEMLDAWQMITQAKPREIVMTIEGEDVRFTRVA